MRYLLGLVAAIVGCGDKREQAVPQPEPPTSAPAAVEGSSEPTDPRPVAPADGLAKAAIASRPFAEWPCGKRFTNLEGERITERFTYGDRRSCTMPISIFHETLGGCPTHLDITYGADGRPTQALGYDYVWGKLGPKQKRVSKTIYEITDLEGDVVLGDGPHGPSLRFRIGPDGNVIAHEQYGAAGLMWARRLEYDGNRVVRIWNESHGVREKEPTEVLYDCSKLPPDPKD